jgi:phage-related minor tail protein
MDVKKLEQAYEKLVKNMGAEYEMGDMFAYTKKELDKKILLGLADGTIQGKNAQEREAAGLKLYEEDFDVLEKIERDYEQAKHNRRVAEIEVRYLRDLLRIEEMINRAEENYDGSN